MTSVSKLIAATVCSVAALGAASHALAQQYPNKPVRMIVPFPPGGGNDAIGRLVAQKMAEGLGQPVIVDNRPGAGTTLGTSVAAKSPADGYTLLLSSVTSHALAPHLYEKPGYNALKDFTGVSMLATTPYILTTGASQPYKSVQEIIAAAKAKPGTLTFASGGIGSNTHLSGAIFEELSGTQLMHIPYKGSAPAITDLLGNVVTMMFDTATAATPQVVSGKLRGLAVTGSKRLPDLPNVPTFAEAGVKNFNASSWYSIHVPAGTPPAIVARLNAEVVRVVNLPEVRTRLLAIGAEPVTGTPEQLDAFVNTEFTQWGALIKKLGVKAE
ncbi:MAG: tripartite tricarboxylate transporter substrate binding protein [Comamonadaceae bacterium]|nr:MAG: tripartite tricarboxylate transporter substrate binding protein [Comamonadaceae bacterium]